MYTKIDYKFESQIQKQENLLLQIQNTRYKNNLIKLKNEYKKLKKKNREDNYYYC